jgi:hypothetical protein
MIVYFTVSQGDIIAMHWKAQGKSEGNLLMLQPSGKVAE